MHCRAGLSSALAYFMIVGAGCETKPEPGTTEAKGRMEQVTIHVPEMAARLDLT